MCILYRRVYRHAWWLVKISLLSGAPISPCKMKQECTIPSPSPPLHTTGVGAVSFAAGGRQPCSCCPCARAGDVDGSRSGAANKTRRRCPAWPWQLFGNKPGEFQAPRSLVVLCEMCGTAYFWGSARAPGSESRCCRGPAWWWGLRRAAARGTGPSEHGLMRSIRIAAFKFHRF